MGPAVVGTLLITGAATLMAVPLGILGAVYLNEYGGKGALAKVIRFMADVMTGVPSIVMGLFVYTIWVLRFGYSAFAGALAPGLPDAAGRDPVDRGDAAASCPTTCARRATRSGASKAPGHRRRRAARRARRHRQRVRCSRSPARPAARCRP